MPACDSCGREAGELQPARCGEIQTAPGASGQTGPEAASYAAWQPPDKKSPYAAVGTGKLFLCLLLLNIPLAGTIVGIAWAAGCISNLFLKRLARAMLLLQALNLVRLILAYALGGTLRTAILGFLSSL